MLREWLKNGFFWHFLTETKCKILFIYVRFNLKKKWDKKGGGGGSDANAINNSILLLTLPLNDPLQRGYKLVVRKNVGNPVDFFDKSWTEYKEGFAANGERDSF